MTARTLPPIAFLRECFSYDPDTGELKWRKRPASHFANPRAESMWNTRFAGTVACATINGGGYAVVQVTFDGEARLMRVPRVIYKIMTGEEPETVDHINRVRSDNRFVNLRAATKRQNNYNKLSGSRSGLPKGVCAHKKKYAARIRINGAHVHLGAFSTIEAAHAAYCAAAKELHGDFFEPGFVPEATDIFS